MSTELSAAVARVIVTVRGFRVILSSELALGGHRLYLRFEDGVAGELDFARRLRFEGVFAPLRDPAVFAHVRIHPELGTLAWPNGADLDPDVLYAELSGTAIRVPPARARRPS